MNEGLEALKEIKESEQFIEFQGTYGSEPEHILVGEFFEEEIDIIEKELKALEIIKSKKVDIRSLDNIICLCATDESALKEYNRCCGKDEEDNDISLTKEEFELLKEVML